MSNDHDRGEILYLALTRPTLVWGVPFEGLALNVFVTFFGGIEFQAPTLWRSPLMFWLTAIPIHLAMQRLTSWDYHWFRTIRLWALTMGTRRATLESMPTQPARTARECSSSG
jgi:type IV secretory pathway VirB3-like protein